MPFAFSLHGVVTVACPGAPVWLRRHLLARFPAAPPTVVPPEAADLCLSPLEDDIVPSDTPVLLSSPYQMAIHPYQGERAMFVRHRGTLGLVFVPGRRIRILYRNDPAVMKRLYLFILFALSLLVRYKAGVFVHGAAAVRDDVCLLLVGLRGSGKSQIFLDLIRRGWRFLADDKLLLHRGRAHGFQPLVGLSDHHLLLQPWLRAAPGLPAVFRWPLPRWRIALRRWLAGLPEVLASAAGRFLAPARQVPVDRLVPGVAVTESAPVSHLLLLENGTGLVLERDAEGVARRAARIQDLVFYQMEPFIRLLRLCDWEPPPAMGPLFTANLALCRRAHLQLEWGGPLAAPVREIERWLAPQ